VTASNLLRAHRFRLSPIAEDPERVAALDHALAGLARRNDRGTTSTIMDWEYLLLTARRRN